LEAKDGEVMSRLQERRGIRTLNSWNRGGKREEKEGRWKRGKREIDM
jgi:hypothetical protein